MVEDRQGELLPVPYFHVVFTLPPPIAAIAFQNKAAVYAILFKSPIEAMTTLAANPRRLGAKVGGLAILHTWGQALTHHPHVHCVVPGGGLSLDGSRWIAGRANFFLAVKPLSRLFRRLFLERLQAAFDAKSLGFFGDLAYLANPAAFAAHLAAARRLDWIVYAKKPFGGPAQVLAYLGRYTHRVAIANSRIQAYDDEYVAFTWKDYRDDGNVKTLRLKPDEFIRRRLARPLPSHPPLRIPRHRDQATANPMNRLHRQLFGGLDRHEAHVRSAYRASYARIDYIWSRWGG
jgi:Putative transposase